MTRPYFFALLTLVVAVLLAFILVNAFKDDPRGEAGRLSACPEHAEDSQKIRRMMERGFDSAFTAQIGQLYKIYGQNAPSVEKQREYTKKGIENAIISYRIAIEAVNGWEC